MSRLITQGQRPRYDEARPYRMSSGRRDHIHGRIQPMDPTPRFPGWLKIALVIALILLIVEYAL